MATFNSGSLDVRREGREPECFPDAAAVEVGFFRQIVDAFHGSLFDGFVPTMSAYK